MRIFFHLLIFNFDIITLSSLVVFGQVRFKNYSLAWSNRSSKPCRSSLRNAFFCIVPWDGEYSVNSERLQNQFLDSLCSFLVYWVPKTNDLTWFLYSKENSIILLRKVVVKLNKIIHVLCTGIYLQFSRVHPATLTYDKMTFGYGALGR